MGDELMTGSGHAPSGVDSSKLTALTEFVGEDEEETAQVREMAERAVRFLRSFDWCVDVAEVRVGDVTADSVVAVFLCRVVANRDDVPEWLWVVVGDVPPAYLVVDDAPNPASALDAYVGEMQEWVAAAKRGEPVDNLIPVLDAHGTRELPPTPQTAEGLERRLGLIDAEILSGYRDDLSQEGDARRP